MPNNNNQSEGWEEKVKKELEWVEFMPKVPVSAPKEKVDKIISIITQELQAKDKHYEDVIRQIIKLGEDNGFDGVGYKRAIEDVKEILSKHNINIE